MAAVSPRIALGRPDGVMQELARRIGELVALRDPGVDEVCLDYVYLRAQGYTNLAWRWEAPLNFFCAQGDRRWWHDRRIPGGLAFSINAVGHMVWAGMLDPPASTVQSADSGGETSLHASGQRATQYAIQTIAMASATPSGPATRVLDAQGRGENTAPPVAEGCFYEAAYHTDVAVPDAYFRPDVERPAPLERCVLAFTTEFDAPEATIISDHTGEDEAAHGAEWTSAENRSQGAGALVHTSACPLLAHAIEQHAAARDDDAQEPPLRH